MKASRLLVRTLRPRLLLLAPAAQAQDKSIVVASTTSTQDSGLFGHILPMFKAKTGIDVKVIAQGTGQAIDTGRRGDADVVFVHAKAQEEKFVADGFGVRRFDVMYNDFVLIGPKCDPAGVKGGKDIVAGAQGDRDEGEPVRLARRQERHACRRAGAVEGGGPRSGRRQARLVSRDRARHGRGAEHREAPWAPTCCPTAEPGCRSRTRAPGDRASRATSGSSTSTASCWSIRPSMRM